MPQRVITINKKLPTRLKKVNPFIKQVIRSISKQARLENEFFALELALEEALTNAMRHGNKLDPKLNVKVSIKVMPQKIILDVHDEGRGFNFLKVPDPTKERHRSKLSGRGIFIMRSIMDSVKFYDKGSGVKLTKSFRRIHEK